MFGNKITSNSFAMGNVKDKVVSVLKERNPTVSTPMTLNEIAFYGFRNQQSSMVKPEIEKVLSTLKFVSKQGDAYYLNPEFMVV